MSRWVLTSALILGAVAALVLATPMIMGALRGGAEKSHQNFPPKQHDAAEEATGSGDDVGPDVAIGVNEEVLWSDALNLAPEDRLYLVR